MSRIELQTEVLGRLEEVLRSPASRPIGVLGLGIAGRAMALLLQRRGARVVGADQRSDLKADDLRAAGVDVVLGPMGPQTFARVELLVVSPGANTEQPAVKACLDRGVPICGELELVSPLAARVAAVTGTNGKSTTTALLGALVKAAGPRTFVGGNLGDPIAGFVLSGELVDVAVIELSSFQLDTAYRFAADVGVMLNITPDHGDRYPSVEAYAHAKERLLENLNEKGVAVLNADDPRVVQMAKLVKGRVLWFSTARKTLPGDGAYLDGDALVPVGALEALGRFDLTHPRLFGRHNRENALAAMLAVHGLGLWRPETAQALAAGYLAFQGLEHRLELVADVGGVRYINDSKATNDDAAAVALQAMDRPVLLLLGGRDKAGGYGRVLQSSGNVRVVLTFGEAEPLIAEAFAGHPGLKRCKGMRDAFELAVKLAQPGEVVLLAPACSSFDEFTDYKHRGKEFKRWVKALGGGGA